MQQAFAPGSTAELRCELSMRLRSLQNTRGSTDSVTIPIGICLVLASEHGGNTVASELIQRFHLLNLESGDAIDFYYLGWRVETDGKGDQHLQFSLPDYVAAKQLLQSTGVRGFSGNADLILVDASVAPDKPVELKLESAIQIDLTRLIAAEGAVLTLGSFFDMLMESARNSPPTSTTVHSLSDRLGMEMGKTAILNVVWKKIGGLIGAERLSQLATRGVGRRLVLD
ncbi:hypothetical protein [Longimicrobium sp.]|uniref:hypothetical protein n=1 Tax=Longimicrobium sp. TaxID=2029185 RepID=UPI003B3A714D